MRFYGAGWFLGGLVLLSSASAWAAPDIAALNLTTNPDGSETYSITLQILLVMTLLTFLPAMLMTMTSFLRIVIVLALLRQALGTMQTPSNQILIGLALFLTFFIMAPIFDRVANEAITPYMDDQISLTQAIDQGSAPMKAFMLAQTRDTDIEMFASIANAPPVNSPQEVPMSLLIPAFITSELKTAFQIGFMIFIPFLIIDLVVASVLMAMGMMMLSPMIVSLPFKLMLFVLVDGWVLIMGTLAASFQVPGASG
jgi:flagellar biosynthetic protein FliP